MLLNNENIAITYNVPSLCDVTAHCESSILATENVNVTTKFNINQNAVIAQNEC